MTFSPVLGRDVVLREQDWQAAEEVEHGYHVPPWPVTVLDCGANVGLVSAHYRKLWPQARIVAVEMSEATAEVGRQNADVEWRVHAVAAKAGTGWYDPYERPIAAVYHPGAAGGVRVRAWTLQDTIMDTFGGPVDFVKMDIEGAEWDVCRRMDDWWRLVRTLLVEFHDGRVEDGMCLLESRYDCSVHPKHPFAVWAVRRGF